MSRIRDVVAVVVGYLLGSLPIGVWFGKAARDIDIREHGSGSTGTTNVLRTVGPGAAGAVFVLDVAKGSVAVGLARAIGCDRGAQAGAGLAAVVGHSWPAFAHLRGGKGVATGFGGLLMMSPEASGTAVVGGMTALAASRIVSVGSLAAAVSATVGAGAAALRRRPGAGAGLAYSVGAASLVCLRHGPNISRLLRGEEPQVSLKKKSPVTAGGAPDRRTAEGPAHVATASSAGAASSNGTAAIGEAGLVARSARRG